jgi:2-polyprenyl-3-methyl-5-hydroxy-6-metoxy-1,4-benzoquinol methylase
MSFVVGDIEKMPFQQGVFDVIICQSVLEHVKGKEKAIGEIAFSLKRGGKILTSTTNAFSPAYFIDDILPKLLLKTFFVLCVGLNIMNVTGD